MAPVSLIELLSAMLVVLQVFFWQLGISQQRASRVAGLLLFALEGIVVTTATVALALRLHPRGE